MKFLNNLATTVLFSVIILSCTAQTKTGLTPDEFEKEITTKENVQVLDVRTPGEYFSGHIKNALQADWNDKKEFDRRIQFIDKSKPVYVYCLGGSRSAAAAEKMRKMGYQNVFELKGGTNAWRAVNKPLEGSSDKKQMSMEEFNAGINGSKTVLVDFGAAWCPPCKMMEPVLASLVANNKEKFSLVKVDGGKDQDLLKLYNVTALPVFIIFKDGKQVWRKDGIADEKELAAQLQ
jgi:thioredoxin